MIEEVEKLLSQYAGELLAWKSWGVNALEKTHNLKVETAKEICQLFEPRIYLKGVEGMEGKLCENGGDNWELAPDEYKKSYRQEVKAILSHPDLALIVNTPAVGLSKDSQAVYLPVIPLAEALKEVKE